jgi:hypothetical protein
MHLRLAFRRFEYDLPALAQLPAVISVAMSVLELLPERSPEVGS